MVEQKTLGNQYLNIKNIAWVNLVEGFKYNLKIVSSKVFSKIIKDLVFGASFAHTKT